MSKSISERIQFLRERKGLSRKVFSEKCNISENTLVKAEGGRVPRIEFITAICEVYPEHVYYLLFGNNDLNCDQVNPSFKKGRKSGTPNKKASNDKS